MKKYYVMFYNGNEKVCGTWKQAENEEQACLFAEIPGRNKLCRRYL